MATGRSKNTCAASDVSNVVLLYFICVDRPQKCRILDNCRIMWGLHLYNKYSGHTVESHATNKPYQPDNTYPSQKEST